MASWHDRPHTLFLRIALVFGTLFLLLTPPARAPNEITHFTRVLGLSQGRLLTETRTSRPVKDFLDAQRDTMAKRFLDHENPHYYTIAEILEMVATNPYPGKPLIKYGRDRAIMYSPVPYIPAVPVVWLASLAHLSPFVMLYLARLSLFLTSTALLYTAIRITPVLQWQMFLIALFPNMVFIRSSVSADSLTVSYVFLFIALLLKTYAGTQVTGRNIFWLTLLASCVCLSKSAYFLMPLLFFLLPRRNFASPEEHKMAALCIVVLPVILGIVWLSMIPPDIYIHDVPGVVEYIQVLFVAQHPLQFIKILLNTWQSDLKVYAVDLYSMLGFWEITLPWPFTVAAYSIMFLLPCRWSASPHGAWQIRQRCMCFIVFMLSLITVSALLYVCNSPVESTYIKGIQGRYFTPSLPLLLVAVGYYTRHERWYKACVTVAAVFTIASLISGLAVYLNFNYDLSLIFSPTFS